MTCGSDGCTRYRYAVRAFHARSQQLLNEKEWHKASTTFLILWNSELCKGTAHIFFTTANEWNCAVKSADTFTSSSIVDNSGSLTKALKHGKTEKFRTQSLPCAAKKYTHTPYLHKVTIKNDKGNQGAQFFVSYMKSTDNEANEGIGGKRRNNKERQIKLTKRQLVAGGRQTRISCVTRARLYHWATTAAVLIYPFRTLCTRLYTPR